LRESRLADKTSCTEPLSCFQVRCRQPQLRDYPLEKKLQFELAILETVRQYVTSWKSRDVLGNIEVSSLQNIR
jgi:hypothetical protein